MLALGEEVVIKELIARGRSGFDSLALEIVLKDE